MNLTNNTARNSHRTADILNHFRAAFYSLKSQITKQFHHQLAQQDQLREQEVVHFASPGELGKVRVDWGEKASSDVIESAGTQPPLATVKGETKSQRQGLTKK